MKPILLILLLALCCSCGRKSPMAPEAVEGSPAAPIDPALAINSALTTYDSNALSPIDYERHIHTDETYTIAEGQHISIQNSYPRGGGYLDATGTRIYMAPDGTEYGHGIFWTRISNETSSSIDLNIQLEPDSISIFPSPESHFRLYLPDQRMDLSQVGQNNYGATGLPLFLDEHFYDSSSISESIEPNEDFVFYLLLLPHVTDGHGATRAGFSLDGEKLSLNIRVGEYGPVSLPCGQITIMQ